MKPIKLKKIDIKNSGDSIPIKFKIALEVRGNLFNKTPIVDT